MSWYPGLNPLRDVLADLYPATSIARVVMTEAGIAESMVDFNGPAIAFWTSIITQAHHNQQVPTLIAVARNHFPKNQQLAEAEQVFQQTPVPEESRVTPRQDTASRTIRVKGNNDGIIVGGDVKDSKIQNVGDITGSNNHLSQ